MNIGDTFIPHTLINELKGMWVPEPLARHWGVSPGAKLAYARLARYAGKDGNCYPSVKSLGSELGVGERQARKYLAELESKLFIRRVTRRRGSARLTNVFVFLWHSIFAESKAGPSGRGRNDRSGGGRNDDAAVSRNDVSGKESQVEDCQFEESHGPDSDYPRTNRKNCESYAELPSVCQQYPKVRQALADYMVENAEDERIYPPDRIVVEVMKATEGATEAEVIDCLRYLREERGLRPGTKHGPRHFQWFPTVVAEHFVKVRAREEVANPRRSDMSRLGEAQFDHMSKAF
jgi:hypothetical protein